MEKLSHKQIKREANKQTVSVSCIYNRIARGWSLTEIQRGYKDGVAPYRKPIDSRYDLSSGQTSFLVLLFDVIKCITKLDDLDNYPLTVSVFHRLIDRRELQCQ